MKDRFRLVNTRIYDDVLSGQLVCEAPDVPNAWMVYNALTFIEDRGETAQPRDDQRLRWISYHTRQGHIVNRDLKREFHYICACGATYWA